MESGRRLAVLVLVALAAALGWAGPASAAEEPEVQSVTIAGEPVVGGALRAVAEVTGDPAPVLTYRWERCDAVSGCEVVAGADSDTYVPVADDVGFALAVRVTATNDEGFDRRRSEPTAPVQPAPAPEPQPEPAPSTDAAPAPVVSAAAPAPATAPAPTPTPVYVLPLAPARRYLRPFPVVRIRGSIMPRGSDVTLLRVRAPLSARVTIRCAGDGCPIRRRTRRAGRVRALERFLPAGVRIVIRVHRRGYVGKYVRIRIRGGRPPARRDACVLSGSSPPIACART